MPGHDASGFGRPPKQNLVKDYPGGGGRIINNGGMSDSHGDVVASNSRPQYNVNDHTPYPPDEPR